MNNEEYEHEEEEEKEAEEEEGATREQQELHRDNLRASKKEYECQQKQDARGGS